MLWSYEARFSLSDESKRLKVEYSLTADQERELIAFNGPMLYAGDGAFGERKTAALFPGLEFLEGDEPSSSSRDVAPPNNNRLVPHPYKITIPLMAVEHKKTLVVWRGMRWKLGMANTTCYQQLLLPRIGSTIKRTTSWVCFFPPFLIGLKRII